MKSNPLLTKRILLLIISAIALMSCDADFRQGDCDEGFFQQANGQGGYHCVPISESVSAKSEVEELEDD